MSRDRSLEEFATESDVAESPETGRDAEDEPIEEPSAEPIETTYAFDGSGGTCADCGASVDERWRDEVGLVCADCKEW